MTEKKKKDFSNGKIYCIRNCLDDDIYIGSTCQPLSKRMTKHRESMKDSKRQHLKIYEKMNDLGIEMFYIELIENYPCENIEQLNRREGEHIREKQSVLNKRIGGRTVKEWCDDNIERVQENKHKYHIQNKEKINERSRQHYQENKEYLKQYQNEYKENNREKVLERKRQHHHENKASLNEAKKQYYKDNRERLLENAKKYQKENREYCKEKSNIYYQENKERINEERKVKHVCECGITYTISNKSRHEKTQHHQNYINKQ